MPEDTARDRITTQKGALYPGAIAPVTAHPKL